MPHSVVVIPAVQSEHHIGLTIRSSDDGVRVLRVSVDDLAHRAGLRVGSLITHLNGIRVTDQHRAVDIIHLARDRLCPLHISVQPPAPSLTTLARRWWSRRLVRRCGR